MPGTSDIVFFAVKAAIRLGAEARRAYVDTTKRRELTLPLPKVELGFGAALQFFTTDPGRKYAAPETELRRSLDAVRADPTAPTAAAERERILAVYSEYWHAELSVSKGATITLAAGDAVSTEDWRALFRVRQLARREDEGAKRTLLLGAITTVVDLGVEYFANVKGSLNEDTKEGRVFRTVVDALDKIELATLDVASDGWAGRLAGRFVVAALETLAERPELAGGDERLRDLIGVAAAGLAGDVAARLAADDAGVHRSARALDWAGVVFRSVLTSAGTKVLDDPARFLGVSGAGREAAVRRVGGAALRLVLDDDGTGPGFDRLLSRAGLETILDAALDVFAEHPDVFGKVGNAGLEAILVDVAKALKEHDLAGGSALLPAIARAVLLGTAKHLELVWPDGAEDPKKHLLLTAARSALSRIAAPPAAGARWTPRFGGAEIEAVLSSVVAELAANPAWLSEGAEKIDADVAAALGAVLDVLRLRAGSTLLSRETAAAVLKAGFRATAQRSEFLAVKIGIGAHAEPLIGSVMDVLFAALFDDAADVAVRRQTLRKDALLAAVDVVLDRLGKAKLDGGTPAILKEKLAAFLNDAASGAAADWTRFGSELAAALAA